MTNVRFYYCIVLNEGTIIQDKYEQMFKEHFSEQKTNLRYLGTKY